MRQLFSRAADWWREVVRAAPINRLVADVKHHDPVIDLLFRDSPDGGLVIDKAGRVLRTNAALRTLAGPGIDLSRGADAALIFDPASRAMIWQKVVQLLRGIQTEVRAVPGRLGPPNGGELGTSVLVSADPVSNGAGTVDGVLVRFTDITRQALLEAQLAQSQKQQAVGQLAGGIAHDFNNLLTAIMGSADAIATRPGIGAEILEEAAQIQNGAERGAALVRHLLAFGRQQTLQPQALAVNDVITSVSALLRRLLGETVRLEVDLEQPGNSTQAELPP